MTFNHYSQKGLFPDKGSDEKGEAQEEVKG